MIELYRNIRKRRIELGLTQDELGKLCGYTNRSSIAKIEAGEIDLPLSKIKLFAKALQTTPDALLGNTLSNGTPAEVEPDEFETIAAHHEGEWTEEDLQDIEDFKEFIRSKKRKEK